MKHLNFLQLIFGIVVIYQLILCDAKNIDGDELRLRNASTSDMLLIVLAVSVAVIVCTIILLFGCADMCMRQSEVKGYDNEEAFSPDMQPTTNSEFTMYPPVENTPDSMSASPVYFEPLPDITGKLRQRQQHLSNTAQLRPKVSVITRVRMSSEDDLNEAVQRDSIQEKMKLQNVLVNARSQLPRSQLQYIKELGNGWFGKVLQGEGLGILPGHKKTKVVIQMLREEADVHDQLAFLQEGMPYRDVDHPNVLKLLGQCVDTSPYLAVLELCPFADLKTYLRSHRVAMESFNEKGLLLKFACDMAAGLQALHQHNFVHRDFAIRNCLLASDLTVKVGDYGLGEEMFKEDYYFDENGDAVAIRWLAPESIFLNNDGSISLKIITRESNIWSYGVALWEVLQFGATPYADLRNNHVLRLVVKEQSLKLPKPDVPVNQLDRIYQLMCLCWSEPGSRPSLRELRIMLLHLLSKKDEMNTNAFDEKWNQLMPRRPPQVRKVEPQTVRNGAIKNVPLTDSIALQPNVTKSTNKTAPPSAARPRGFEVEFTSNNSELFSGEHPLSSESDDIPRVHRNVKATDLTSPVNELSLEAELGMHGFSGAVASPVNEISLEDELKANAYTPSDDSNQMLPSANEKSLFSELHTANNDPNLEYDSPSREPSRDPNFKDGAYMQTSDPNLLVPSPGNEFSLEAELSAAGRDILAQSSPIEPHNKGLAWLDQNLQKNIAAQQPPINNQVSNGEKIKENVEDLHENKPTESNSKEKTDVKEDVKDTSMSLVGQNVGQGEDGHLPSMDEAGARDSVEGSLNEPSSRGPVSQIAKGDFMTSTPKKLDDTETFLSTNQTNASESQGSHYQTALTSQESTTSRDSAERSFEDYDDCSLFGQKKFAAILQTVTTSIDEDMDPYSFSLGSSLENVEEDPFSFTKTPEQRKSSGEEDEGNATITATSDQELTPTAGEEDSPTPPSITEVTTPTADGDQPFLPVIPEAITPIEETPELEFPLLTQQMTSSDHVEHSVVPESTTPTMDSRAQILSVLSQETTPTDEGESSVVVEEASYVQDSAPSQQPRSADDVEFDVIPEATTTEESQVQESPLSQPTQSDEPVALESYVIPEAKASEESHVQEESSLLKQPKPADGVEQEPSVITEATTLVNGDALESSGTDEATLLTTEKSAPEQASDTKPTSPSPTGDGSDHVTIETSVSSNNAQTLSASSDA